tara:strand:- start:1166 stop:1954 length:789 start_codon:yes stop_codon:yes gene_type:complete
MKRLLKRALAFPTSFRRIKESFNEIEVETISFCNRKCSYCPNISFDRVESSGSVLMDDSVLDTIFVQLESIGFKGIFSPHMYGEPLLDPRIVDIVKRISDLGAIPKIVTNGDYLTPNLLQELLASGLKILYISKHSPRLSSSAMNTLKYIEENHNPQLSFQVLDFYSDFKSERNMVGNRGGNLDIETTKKPPIMCPYVLYPVIDVNGVIVLCCQDFNSDYQLGKVTDRHIYEIWNDPMNVAMRRNVFKGKFDLSICQHCLMD